jgi:hypothetical protein
MAAVRMLVVVNESAAIERVLTYVVRLLGEHPGVQVGLARALPPVPPALLEFGGTEDPREERRRGAELRAKRRAWHRAATESVHRSLAGARQTLCGGGIPPHRIRTHVFGPADGRDAAERILRTAQTRRYRTVVIGRDATSRVRRYLKRDLARELVRRSQGVTVWVVE